MIAEVAGQSAEPVVRYGYINGKERIDLGIGKRLQLDPAIYGL
jgi:hypothetical protein